MCHGCVELTPLATKNWALCCRLAVVAINDSSQTTPLTSLSCPRTQVYMEPSQLGTAPLLASWLATLSAHYPDWVHQRLEALFNAYAVPALRFVRKEVSNSRHPDACPNIRWHTQPPCLEPHTAFILSCLLPNCTHSHSAD